MEIQIQVILLSFVISIIAALIILPILRRLKVGQIERDDGPESHLKKQGTPTMGGIIMAVTIAIATAVVFVLIHGGETKTVAEKIIPLTFVTIGFGVVGFVDDFKKLVLKNTKGLKPMYKMIGLLIVSVVYTLYIAKFSDIGTDTYIPIIKQYINLPIWLYIPFAIFVLLGTTNAVNLTDGIDGLATSVTTIIITALTVISTIFGVQEVSFIGCILVGACLGFLIFNLHPAKVFMGDTGSLALGAVMASIAIIVHREITLLVVAGVFVVETLSVILQVFWLFVFKKKLFLMTPLHHHFEKLGWSEVDIVKAFLVVGLTLAMAGIFFGVWL